MFNLQKHAKNREKRKKLPPVSFTVKKNTDSPGTTNIWQDLLSATEILSITNKTEKTLHLF
jgi:hypothetical protein